MATQQQSYWRIPPKDAISWAINILIARFRTLSREDRLDIMELLEALHSEAKVDLPIPTEESVAALDAIREILEDAPGGMSKLL